MFVRNFLRCRVEPYFALSWRPLEGGTKLGWLKAFFFRPSNSALIEVLIGGGLFPPFLVEIVVVPLKSVRSDLIADF